MDISTSENGKLLLQPKSPHFFEVVFSPLDQGIKIPTVFLRKYGESLEKVVILKAPDGAAWPVELLKIHNGETWLQKGWQEFGEFYGIKRFYFLVFRYDGNSQFHVTILDTTATEIDYPVNFLPIRHEKVAKTRIKSEVVDDWGDDDSKRGNVAEAEKDGMLNIGRRLRQRINKESCGATSRTLPQPCMPSPNLAKEGVESLEAYKRARAFRSENPFFICFLRPSYISSSYGLNIPAAFARGHLTGNCGEKFELSVPEGTKRWSVHVVVQRTRAKMYRGWRQFAEENSLIAGDVCLFELVKETKLFNVIVYRKS